METPDPYAPCRLCPRRCGVMRRAGSGRGYCGEGAALRLACASIHRGEEPPLTGTGGSGTIFVSGCSLGCIFCQNRQISRGPRGAAGSADQVPSGEALGRIVDAKEFARICLALQNRGAENINIVTGTHAVPALVKAIAAARRDGAALDIPVLWNSSGYEVPETLDLLSDTVEVFLPDLKTLDSAVSERYFNAPDYPDRAVGAIQKMLALRPLRFEKRDQGPDRMVSGVMVRHMVLPGCLESTRHVLRWFAEHCAGRAMLSLMFQYTSISPRGTAPVRRVNKTEYRTVLHWLDECGIEDGYCQDLSPDARWIPDFEQVNPFPTELSIPVWHWRRGFV